jgi:RNA polymerase sigma-70 factor (ECF subfamily)
LHAKRTPGSGQRPATRRGADCASDLYRRLGASARRHWADDRTVRRDKFERMYVEHRDGLFAFLAYRTGDRTLAEDLLGDVFERALRAHVRFDPRRGSETTWLYAIAVNRLRDHHRRALVERRALERVGIEEAVPADPRDDRFADRERVMRALEFLSPQDREIVALRFGADLTAPQIARVTQKPLTTIEGRLYRALRRLRALLEPDEPVSSKQAPVASLAPAGTGASATGETADEAATEALSP